MEKRVLLAVALSFGVLYVYQVFFPPAKPPVTATAAPSASAAPAS